MVGEDVRSAFRSLTRAPAFAVLVVGILTIGIGLNTAAISVLSAFMLRPLPFPDADRIVQISPIQGVSWNELDDIFDPAVSWDLDAFTLLDGDQPRRLRGAWVTPGFFELHGVQAALGRLFLPSESGEGAASVMVLSHETWQSRYGGDPDVLGRTVSVFTSDRPDDAEVFTIVGVLPEDFWFYLSSAEVLAPLKQDRSPYVARLRSGVSIESAVDYLTTLAASRMDHVPEGFRAELTPLRAAYVSEVRPVLRAVAVAVLLVLLIACVNTGVLLMVRTSGREGEFAVRAALGAGRGRIARQLMWEGSLLAGVAGVLGAGLASLALAAFGTAIEQRLGTAVPGGVGMLRTDGFTVLLTAGITGVAALVFGVVPMMALGGRAFGALRAGARPATSTRGRRLLRDGMVVAEVAVSLALLVGAGLMVRSALYLQRRDLGFRPERLAVVDIQLRRRMYPELGQRVEFFRRLVEETAALPGVEAADVVLRAPFLWRFGGQPLETEEQPMVDRTSAPEAMNLNVGRGYFDVMGIPLIRGRGFGDQDVEGAPPVVVVSQSLAQRLWPGQDPLGRNLRYPPAEGGASAEPVPWLRVVGVVGDVIHQLPDEGPETYTPVEQGTPAIAHLVVRTQPAAGRWHESLLGVVRSLDPEVPASAPLSIQEGVDRALGNTRFLASLLTAFAVFAFMLAVFGLYGVVAYTVARGKRDVAIRVALGAQAGTVLRRVLGEGLVLIFAGVIFGLLGARALSTVLASQLHGVTALDGATFGGITLALSLAAGVAVVIPARRAAAADPMDVLRQE